VPCWPWSSCSWLCSTDSKSEPNGWPVTMPLGSCVEPLIRGLDEQDDLQQARMPLRGCVRALIRRFAGRLRVRGGWLASPMAGR